jgi:hypothetical protein
MECPGWTAVIHLQSSKRVGRQVKSCPVIVVMRGQIVEEGLHSVCFSCEAHRKNPYGTSGFTLTWWEGLLRQ